MNNNWNPPLDAVQLNSQVASYEIVKAGIPVCPIERVPDEYEWSQNIIKIVKENMIGNVNYSIPHYYE